MRTTKLYPEPLNVTHVNAEGEVYRGVQLRNQWQSKFKPSLAFCFISAQPFALQGLTLLTSVTLYTVCFVTLEKQDEALACIQHVLYWSQVLKQVLGFDMRSRGLKKIMCVRSGALTRHARSWAPKHYSVMSRFPKISPQCQLFLEVLLGAPDGVLIWFRLDCYFMLPSM